ncbi:hypothetical protein OB905_01520 [Halobacteria archaeon AArc-dxtr1]|nr:hypothetical protein [Halobacteria archaeon AArc-dxtr1]
MSVPEIVHSTLDGEDVATRVSLGGDDELFVTPTRTIVYRADGLLSDETVEEYGHDADRLTLSEGRRKTRIGLEYTLEGTHEFTVPSSSTESTLHAVLAGVLSGNGITEPGESVVQTYRFSELTVILTSNRLVKHIGEAVWDGDFEEYHFDKVSDLSIEDGNVATQIVLVVDGRPQRIKAPNEDADDLRERLERAICSYHGVGSLDELAVEDETDDDPADPASAFGEGVEPLSASSADKSNDEAATEPSSETDDPLSGFGGVSDSASEPTTDQSQPLTSTAASEDGGQAHQSVSTADPDTDEQTATTADADVFEGSGFEPADTTDPALLERIDHLEEAIEEQHALLEHQQETIEQLIEELRRGR